MKNSILNLGKTLNKTEQKKINGGLDELIPVPVGGCGSTGGSVARQSPALCSIYGGIYLGNDRCLICH